MPTEVNERIVRAGRLVAFAVLFGVASAQHPIPGPPEFFQLLRTRIGVSDRDLSATLAGRPLAMLLPVRDKGEIAVAGVERLRVPLEFFLDSFSNVPTLKRGRQLLQIHDFSSPPRQQDLNSFVLSQEDMQALQSCMPGGCGVKLSAPMMNQLRSDALGSSSTNRAFRGIILQYLTQYLEKGNPAMIAYADKLPATRSADEFRALLHELDWLSLAAPPLYSCLESFSGNACPQVETFVYWSSAKFGFKTVFSINQVMIYRTALAGQPWVYIAFKQIYADHYFDGSLALAVLAKQSSEPTNPELWLLYLNRSHTDALKGWFGPLKRRVARQRSRAAMLRTLLELKDSLERKYSLQAELPRQ